jgi:hypothetical protein
MLFGMPRPTYESYQSYQGDFVETHDDGRMARSSIDDTLLFGDVRCTSCPVCRCALKTQPWMTSRTVTCIWLYGPTGTGQTRAALDDLETRFGESGDFLYQGSLEFMGYHLERGMLIDNYDPAEIQTEQLLSIISGDAAYADPGHGAERLPLLTELVYITSVDSPESYFPAGSPILGLLAAVSGM